MEAVWRASAIYWFLWLVVRGTGKRSLAQMSPLDMLLVIVIGDVIQQSVTQEDMSVTGGVIATSVFVVWMVLGDWLSRRSEAADRILQGSPVLLVRDGEPCLDAIHAQQLTIEDLHGAARQRGIANLADVAFAVLEPDGQFSFVRWDRARTDEQRPQTAAGR